MDVPENLWLERARAGDREALGRLLEFYKPACYCFALNLVGHADAAEDLCQEAFLLAMRHLPSWRPSGSFRSWLLSIVAHAYRDLADSDEARRRRERRYTMERDRPKALGSGDLERDELRGLLKAALGRLGEEYRLPILLHYEQGFTYMMLY